MRRVAFRAWNRLLDVPFAVLDFEHVTRRRAHRLVWTIRDSVRELPFAFVAGLAWFRRRSCARRGVWESPYWSCPGCSPTASRARRPRLRGVVLLAAVFLLTPVAALIVLSARPADDAVAAAPTAYRIVPDRPAAAVAGPTEAAAEPRLRRRRTDGPARPRAPMRRRERRSRLSCTAARVAPQLGAAPAECGNPAPVGVTEHSRATDVRRTPPAPRTPRTQAPLPAERDRAAPTMDATPGEARARAPVAVPLLRPSRRQRRAGRDYGCGSPDEEELHDAGREMNANAAVREARNASRARRG